MQWLDPSSSGALAFALRRIQRHRVLLLLARRLGESVERSELERAIGTGRVERLQVGPLSLGAIQRLLQERLGRTLARPTLLRVHETSGGNPFYALELARTLAANVDPTQPLPVPETLEELVRARLDGLPDTTRIGLALISALGDAPPEILGAGGTAEEVLEPAFAAHVLEHADNGALRFSHPLLGSVVYQGLPARERRLTHRALADLLQDPVGRARHLALSTVEPDAAAAAAIEHAAALVKDRGAPIVAAELGEHALRLTPPDGREDRHRRAIATARAHLAAGNMERSRALAGVLLSQSPPGRRRAEALILLSDLAANVNVERGIGLRREALAEAAEHPALQAQIHGELGWDVRFTEGPQAAERHARASLELAEELDDDALRAGALAAVAAVRFHLGEPDALGLAEASYELAATAADPERRLWIGLQFASALVFSGRVDRARSFLEPLYEEWKERDDQAAKEALWRLSLVEFYAGRFDLAAEYAGHAGEIFAQYASDEPANAALAHAVAVIAAHRGDHDMARGLSERVLAEGRPNPWFVAYHEAVLGQVALWTGDPFGAAERFEVAEQARSIIGSREPTLAWWRADHVEALLELGRADDAVGVLDPWEADAARLSRDRVLAQATRCRGLVAAARGDVAGAMALLEQAVAGHEAASDPFGRARALLALGVLRRRARLKRAAREAIETAVAGFTTAGATSWAEKARAELGRIGGRTRIEGLSPAEQRVAALVVEGRTNREVASALSLGERTVETHLTHIYAKLGVRSRTQLARTLASAS